MRPHSAFLLFILLNFVPYICSQSTARTSCYAPDGVNTSNENADGWEIVPCIAIEGVHSMCCRLNATYPELCLSNGLCQNDLPATTYWRGYCTDPTWQSPNCIPKDVCSDTAMSNSGASPVTLCPTSSSLSWCCGLINTTCCSGTDSLQLTNPLVKFANDSSTANTSGIVVAPDSSFSSVATNTQLSMASNTSCPSVKSDTVQSTAIGFGVGVPLFVLAIVGSVSGFWFGRRKGLQGAAAKAVGDGENELKAY